MIKHTQTIRWQVADKILGCVWSFFGVSAQRVNLGLLPYPTTILSRDCHSVFIEHVLWFHDRIVNIPMVTFILKNYS